MIFGGQMEGRSCSSNSRRGCGGTNASKLVRHGHPIKQHENSWHLFSLVLTCHTCNFTAARRI